MWYLLFITCFSFWLRSCEKCFQDTDVSWSEDLQSGQLQDKGTESKPGFYDKNSTKFLYMYDSAI